MATRLQWLLRSLCSRRTLWNYAVFWKLRHHVPMLLTCEDAHYYNRFEHDTSDGKSFEISRDSHFAHDPLGLAVEKMSYHVYYHGEGIVGQVAVTGSHRWICAGDHAMYSFPSPELDAWRTQLSVGIKTIVYVAVSHGVLQLGSCCEVNEDLKLLSYIRNLFSSLQDSSICHVQNPFNICTNAAMQQMPITSSTISHPNILEKHTTVLDQEHRSCEAKLMKPFTSVPPEKQKAENNAEVQSQCEIAGAAGPTILRQCYPCSCEVKDTNDRSTHSIVENVVSRSMSESTLTTEANPQPYFDESHTIGSPFTDCSSTLEEGPHDCWRFSDSSGVGSSTSVCKEPMVNPIGPGRSNKKRARPKDRQLIEDCIKQLRRLVPNGSKCSIDSLLERTIKHMVFLQDVAMKVEQFVKCPKSRSCGNETRMLGSGYDHGSCWAMEVGEDTKICPIMVENLSVDGQMLIEMSFEDCHNFLEIAEAIRSLGLTILKALTETHGEKVWLRFVVEGRGSRILHRTQVLWSLLQLLQVETIVT